MENTKAVSFETVDTIDPEDGSRWREIRSMNYAMLREFQLHYQGLNCKTWLNWYDTCTGIAMLTIQNVPEAIYEHA